MSGMHWCAAMCRLASSRVLLIIRSWTVIASSPMQHYLTGVRRFLIHGACKKKLERLHAMCRPDRQEVPPRAGDIAKRFAHGGGGGRSSPLKEGGGVRKGARVTGQFKEVSLKPPMITHRLRREAARKSCCCNKIFPCIPQMTSASWGIILGHVCWGTSGPPLNLPRRPGRGPHQPIGGPRHVRPEGGSNDPPAPTRTFFHPPRTSRVRGGGNSMPYMVDPGEALFKTRGHGVPC